MQTYESGSLDDWVMNCSCELWIALGSLISIIVKVMVRFFLLEELFWKNAFERLLLEEFFWDNAFRIILLEAACFGTMLLKDSF